MSYLTGDSLKVRIRIAFGASIAAEPTTWSWTDVTAWWYVPDDVTITWGRSSGADQPEHSTLSLTLKNTDGRFTAYDARSPYWPHVRKWTPISWDVDLGDGAGWRNRFSGFIRKLPLTWPGASPLMALARIDAVGVLGRLGRGRPPARSALRRTITASGAVAYWPAEDGAAAAGAGSALAGHDPLQLTGNAEFVEVDDRILSTGRTVRYGTGRIMDLAGGGRLAATVPSEVTAATATAWTAGVAAQIDVASASGDVVLLEVDTPGGTYVKWQLVLVQATLHGLVVAIDPAGGATTLIDIAGVTTSFSFFDLSVWQSTSIRVGLRWSHGLGLWAGTATVPGTVTGITAVRVNPTGATSSVPWPVGHVAVWPDWPYPPGLSNAADAYGVTVSSAIQSWRDEAAHDRLARLAAEDGVPLSMSAVPADLVQRMGWQPAAAPLALYQECEAADGGLLYEDGFGLGYLPRSSRYNPPVALTIDANLGQLGGDLAPVDDDQALRNRWTVDRPEGSSAIAEDLESIDLQGEIEGSATVNVAADTQLPDQAAWRLHLSTVQEPRYPTLSVNVSSHRELAAAWCVCRPGSRVQVVNPPPQNTPGVVDQLVVGAKETYRGRRSWRVSLNLAPASPWLVATVDGDQRVAADGSTLAADLSASGMSLSLASTASNGPWTTDPSDFPVDLRVGGEIVTASAISGGSSPQTVTLSARAVNGVSRAWLAGTEVDVAYPAIVPL